jgi:hypothetical protein
VQNLVFFLMRKHRYRMLEPEVLMKYSKTCLKRNLGRKESYRYRKTVSFNLTSSTSFKRNLPPPPQCKEKSPVAVPFQAGFTAFGSKREFHKLRKLHNYEFNTVLADSCIVIVQSRRMRRAELAATRGSQMCLQNFRL